MEARWKGAMFGEEIVVTFNVGRIPDLYIGENLRYLRPSTPRHPNHTAQTTTATTATSLRGGTIYGGNETS